ncbi:thioredoxin [Flectobacillus major]|uniref:thioredoxin n=1 Tax=Flectobacillus major TaxID=103 RepID=UPI0005C53561|nr:thioredoxin [Flectobacillus major]
MKNNDNNLEKLILGKTPILVDFFAEWCQPCRTLAPILNGLAKQLGDGIIVFKVDVDKKPQIAKAYRVQSMPTLLLFQQGKLLWRHTGVVSKQQLEQVIKSMTIKPYLLQ